LDQLFACFLEATTLDFIGAVLASGDNDNVQSALEMFPWLSEAPVSMEGSEFRSVVQ